MRILNVHDDPAHFFAELASAKRRVLVVDYDNLIAPQKAAASSMPYPSISELLDCIMTTGRTRVVLITDQQKAEWAPLVPGPAPDIWAAEGSTGAKTMLPAMLSKLGEDTAVAFLSHPNQLVSSLPPSSRDSASGGKSGAVADNQAFVQFLVDWLRVCGGEIC